MILIHLILHYVRNLLLSCKSQFFWPSGIWRRFSTYHTLFLHFCDYLRFGEEMALQIPFSKEIVSSLIEMGLLVLEKKTFKDFFPFINIL
jgi:hypothetical protein